MKHLFWIIAILFVTFGLLQPSNADYDSDFNELFGAGPSTPSPSKPAPAASTKQSSTKQSSTKTVPTKSTPNNTIPKASEDDDADAWKPQFRDEEREVQLSGKKPQKTGENTNQSKNNSSLSQAKARMNTKKFTATLAREKDPEKKAELLRQAENNETLQAAKPILEKPLYQKLDTYYQALSKKANLVVSAKIKKANIQMIQNLQAKAKDARGKNLSKEQLGPIIDDVYNSIMGECWVEPSELIKGDAKLQELRDAVLIEGEAWDVMAEMWNSLNADPLKAPHCPTVEELLELEELDAVLISMPTSKQGKLTLAQNRKLSTSIDIEEAMCIAVSNRYRIVFGLEPQLTDVLLCATARDHSHDMLNLDFFSHESPVKGKKSFSDRAKRFGAKNPASENIYYGSTKGAASAEAWFHSPGHHKNLMNGSVRMGVGRCGNRHTQMTGR